MPKVSVQKGCKLISAITVLSLSMMSTGCVTPPSDLYYWGSYEPLLLNMYVKPGQATPAEQIIQLEADLQRGFFGLKIASTYLRPTSCNAYDTRSNKPSCYNFYKVHYARKSKNPLR